MSARVTAREARIDELLEALLARVGKIECAADVAAVRGGLEELAELARGADVPAS